MKKALEGLDPEVRFTVSEAVKALRERATAKFDETVEMSMNLGIDPRHADQTVRGAVTLPNGTGKALRVAVFAKGDKAKEAKDSGADIVGAEDLVESVQKGEIDFDSNSISTPRDYADCGDPSLKSNFSVRLMTPISSSGSPHAVSNRRVGATLIQFQQVRQRSERSFASGWQDESRDIQLDFDIKFDLDPS